MKNKKVSVLSAWETSRYWMNSDIAQRLDNNDKTNLTELAGFQRAIANFVRITTGKEIPVKFNTRDSSFTDGTGIVLSAKLDDKLFDCNVGLALHEGSHILLTDFNLLRDALNGDDRKIFDELGHIFGQYQMSYQSLTRSKIFAIFKDLLNIIEDRRIDFYVYNNAPGYRGYYLAMYSHYFNSEAIDTALRYKLKNEEIYEHYLFHMINIMNPNRNLKTLKKLQAIWDTIDLHNIGRLKSTRDAADIVLEIMHILKDEILVNVDPAAATKPAKEDKTEREDSENGANEKSGSENSENGGNESEDSDSEDSDTEDSEDGESEDIESDEDSNPLDRVDSGPTADDMTSAERKLIEKSLEKAIEAQKDFLAGDLKKSTVSKKEDVQLQSLVSPNVDLVDVNTIGKSLTASVSDGNGGADKIKCLVINKITEQTRESFDNMFYHYCERSIDKLQQALAEGKEIKNKDTLYHQYMLIQKGMKLGTMLGGKLKVRNEERSLTSTRLRDGRIDKRLIAEIGYGAEAVFSKLLVKTVNPVHIHCSIDASGSMSGRSWNSAITTATAIAKACSMISGVTMTMSFRTTTVLGRETMPAVVIAYDSTKDNINSLYKTLIYMAPTGSTPEGLCFEALQKTLQSKMKHGTEGLFINISDGQPCFSVYNKKSSVKYYGLYAQKHTQIQVNNIQKIGYTVLSYFVSAYGSGHVSDRNAFTNMYGKSAQFVDSTQLMELSRTINAKLLEATSV